MAVGADSALVSCHAYFCGVRLLLPPIAALPPLLIGKDMSCSLRLALGANSVAPNRKTMRDTTLVSCQP